MKKNIKNIYILLCFVFLSFSTFANDISSNFYMDFGFTISDADDLSYLIFGKKHNHFTLMSMNKAVSENKDVRSIIVQEGLNYSNPNYPEFKEISVVEGNDNFGNYFNINLPSIQYSTDDLKDQPFIISDCPTSTEYTSSCMSNCGNNLIHFETWSLEGLFFEILGGNLKMYKGENTLNNMEFVNALFYLYIKNIIINSLNLNNSLSFKNFLIHDGNENPFLLNGKIKTDSIIINNKKYIVIEFLDWSSSKISIRLGEMLFCNKFYSQIEIKNICLGNSKIILAETSSGIEMSMDLRIDIDEIRSKYSINSMYDNYFYGIHIAGSASGNDDDPSSWSFSNGFKIGTIGSGKIPDFSSSSVVYHDYNSEKFATIDIKPESISMNLPLKGSLRIEKAKIGGTDFGPIIIDDIYLPHMKVELKNK